MRSRRQGASTIKCEPKSHHLERRLTLPSHPSGPSHHFVYLAEPLFLISSNRSVSDQIRLSHQVFLDLHILRPLIPIPDHNFPTPTSWHLLKPNDLDAELNYPRRKVRASGRTEVLVYFSERLAMVSGGVLKKGASCEKEKNSGRMFPIRFLYAAEGHCRGSVYESRHTPQIGTATHRVTTRHTG